MKKNRVRMLPEKQVSAILSFIKEKSSLEKGIFNKVLRDDIFQLLERQDCIVLYYPKEDEENGGFHVMHPLCGKLKKFVYINTAQLKETQIFAAAHELGHIWGIVDYMKEKGFSDTDEADWDEWIINRFAAELLMPNDAFHYYCEREFAIIDEQYKHNQIPLISVISVITAIMNEFLTPFKSVVHRFYELGVISNDIAFMLLEEYDLGEVYSAAMCVVLECDYLLSDDNKAIRHIGSITKRVAQRFINVYNRQQCCDLVKETGLMRRKELRLLGHKVK